MIRAGIIGCGKIADQHAEAIRRIPDSKLVAVCDREILMAKQLQERYDVEKCFDNVEKFLDNKNMDVVHITTPPQCHFDLGITCLKKGFHVYMEKPFAINAAQTAELLKLAAEKGRKITAGHNCQFTHAAKYCREIIRMGFLGGPPIHVESYYCYDFSDEAYAKALLGDSKHWVRKLPGRLLQNIISHGISRIAEFIDNENPKILAIGARSPLLKKIGENDIIDELRVVIDDGGKMTAFFTFSSQFSPPLHQMRLYGPKNSLILDDDNQTVIKIRGRSYKSYLNQFVPPFVYAGEYLGNLRRNIVKFLRNDFHNDSGMKNLIAAFYYSILHDAPLPIPPKEILITQRIMDKIFSQLYPDGGSAVN